MIIKKEMKKEEVKSDRAKSEEADTVFTRASTDTPTHTSQKDLVTNTGGTVVTSSRPTSSGETEEEQEADYGDSDGENMRRMARPKHTSVVYMRRTRPVPPAGKSLEDKKFRRAPPKQKGSEEENSPRQRKKKRMEIQKSIDKRKEAANKRKRSIEGLNRRKPTFQVETRELSSKELQAEESAAEQELAATRTGGIPIVGPIKYPAGPLLWETGKKVPTHEAAISSGGPTLGGLPPGLRLPSPPEAVEAKTSKNRRRREREPDPRISDEEYKNVGRALGNWAMIETPLGDQNITDDIFFEEKATAYAKQGRLFCLEARRTRNFTYFPKRSDGDYRPFFRNSETKNGL